MLSPIELDDDTLEVVVGLMEDDVEQEATVPDNEVVVACESFCSFVFFCLCFLFFDSLFYFGQIRFVCKQCYRYVCKCYDAPKPHVPITQFFLFSSIFGKKIHEREIKLMVKKDPISTFILKN